MAKKNDIWMAVVIGALILGGIYLGASVLGNRGTASITNPINLGGSTVTTNQTTCQATPYSLLLKTRYSNTATVPATPTQVGVAYSVYTNGNPLPAMTGTTLSNTSASLSSINCNSNYKIFAGDNSAYFLTEKSVKSVNVNQQVSLLLSPVSTPTVAFNNGSIAGYVTQGVFHGIANGFTETELQTKISAGSGFFGNPTYAVMFAYNPTEIQSVHLSGYSTTSVPSSAVSVPAGYSTVAYSLPQTGKYQSVILNPIIITGTLPSNTAIASSINMYLISEASYNYNGALKTGLYVNPSTQSALISTVSSVATSSGTAGINIFG